MTAGRHASRALLLSCCLAALGCAGLQTVPVRVEPGLAWPADAPRVRLVSVVDLRAPARSSFGRSLAVGTRDDGPVPVRRPYGVAWDGEDLLVVDSDAARVARVDPRGRITLSAAGVFQQPIAVSACREGIVVSDPAAGRVALLDQELRLVRWIAGDLSRPTGVACDGGRTFVVETAAHRVVVLEDGAARPVAGGRGEGPGQFNFPVAIAVSGGDLLVGDSLNFRIQRLDAASGAARGSFGELGDAPGATPRVKGIAVDAGGRVWVSDGYLDRVSVYDPDGGLLLSIGGTGAEDGEFSFPAGVAAHPDGRVVVADSLNQRLQVFRWVDEKGAPAGDKER